MVINLKNFSEFKKPEKEKPWLNKNENPETVFVNKLPPSIKKTELREIFEKVKYKEYLE